MKEDRKKRSVVIPQKKLKSLRAKLETFHTLVEAAAVSGIDRVVLYNIQQFKNTCSPETLNLIEAFLNNQKQVA